jgi:hypothetical protein
MADEALRIRRREARARQRARSRLFTQLYSLSLGIGARDFIDTLTDVAELLSRHAPLEGERAEWQCVRETVQGCLDRTS